MHSRPPQAALARLSLLQFVACGLTLAVGITACSPAATSTATSTATPVAGARHAWTIPDTLRIGTGLVPRTLDPLLGTQTVEVSLERLFSSLLITDDADGKLIPDLAAQVPTQANGGISNDGLTIRYTLRKNVTWQDGQPFSSADVAFTYDAIMNRDNDIISRHGYDDVASVQTPDASTIVFHLKHRFAPFVATVFSESDEPYTIVPKHILAKYHNINNVPFNSLPIGTGPFRVVKWERGNQIELVRYDKYFRGRPKLKSIVVKLIPDENTEITELQTHEIDWFFEASVNAYKSLRRIPLDQARLVLTRLNGFEGVMFNTARKPVSDLRIRRAVQLALDKPALVKSLTFEAADLATEDLPSWMWAYDRAQQATPYDPAQAKALLAQAGYGPQHRLGLDLYYEQSQAVTKALAVQMQAALAPLGIDLRVHPQLSSIIYGGYGAGGTLATGKYDMALYQWFSGIDPDDSAQFVCANIPPHGYNQTRLCDPAMDAAQNVALTHYDEPTRKAAYARVEYELATRIPIDFLWWPKNVQAINPDFHGFAPSPTVETWNAWQWSI